MTKREQIKYKLLNHLCAFESDLSNLTIKNYRKIMKHVHKLSKAVEKAYKRKF